MEVGIRKGAWRRVWRYPAYLWSLRWVYAVQKKPRGWYTAYTRVYPPIHHCLALKFFFTDRMPFMPYVLVILVCSCSCVLVLLCSCSGTEWPMDWQVGVLTGVQRWRGRLVTWVPLSNYSTTISSSNACRLLQTLCVVVPAACVDPCYTLVSHSCSACRR